ncbi:MAG: RagB/SusD family nutrient uptake outer membrane protein [Dysgonomonas sp.]|nr:RagB/SusD family nutrient uptake outer membrane protein [Dysgonomonas sp.]
MKKIINNSKRLLYIAAVMVFATFASTSCTSDLDTVPKGPNVQLDPYADPANYPLLVAKVYAGFSKLGLKGPDGDGDIPSSSDQGKTNFLRIYFNIQELTADQAKCAWNDNDEKNYSQTLLAPDNNIGYMLYQRCMLNIVFTNEFLRNTDPPVVEVADINRLRAEVKVLRAMNYYFLMDVFGNPGWVTEEHPVDGSYYPQQLGREGMFNWIEGELKGVLAEGSLKDKSASTYGLVTNQVVQTILAKMYINAEVYTGKARWSDALTYAKMVTSYSGLALDDNYQNIFCADNDRSNEIIFALPYDFDYATDWGGMTAIMAASTGGDMTGDLLNFTASWSGNRATQQLTNLFSSTDKRALFFTTGRTKDMTELGNFNSGWSVKKYTNRGWNDAANTHGNDQWVDTDFPMFRLADVILIQAEAELRTNDSNAVGTFNKVHAHARTGLSTVSSITLQDILDERGRELYWEAQRRTDLIRFGKFASGYNWAWKGGVQNGKDIDNKYIVFPISTRHLTGNPDLKQNEGYN